MRTKLKIIDAIAERHPSIGVKKGWSKYVGGMADTGHWLYSKMAHATKEELQLFLDEIIKEESIPVAPKSERELRDSKKYLSFEQMWMTKYENDQMKDFYRDLELKKLYNQNTRP